MFLDVDNFAGGGGASKGIEAALGKPVDIAVNHDPEAVAMHRANHPATHHECQDIWNVDPAEVRSRGPIRLAWFSPDCTHFSKAKGSRPIRDEGARSRDLAWVVVEWARKAKPAIIMLENVEEFATWGPLGPDGRPCKRRKGQTFGEWVEALRAEGYQVEWRELRACDYGAPTIRKRLFIVARCDGRPIRWPAPTHGGDLLGLPEYRTAAECIDWSIPCPSIFLTPEEAREQGCRRPLAEATMRRIARGVFRYVINAAEPFIVPVTHTKGRNTAQPIHEPMRTITTAKGGEFALAMPYFVPRYGEREGQDPRVRDVREPMPAIVPSANGASLVSAFLAQHNTDMVGHDARKPMSTIVGKGCTQAVVAAHLTRQFGASVGQPVDAPAPTVTAGGGGKTGLVTAYMMNQMTSNTNGGNGDLTKPLNTILAGGQHKALVQAFLMKYYGTGGQYGHVGEPAPTVTTLHRLGLVTVGSVDYQIVDIGMRMLTPRELFRAQGFPDSYKIAVEHEGKVLSKRSQIRLCGNSVCPDVSEDLVRANVE